MKLSVDNQCITLDDKYIMKDTYLYLLLHTEISVEMKDDCIILSDIDINELYIYINYLQGDNTFEMTEELSLFFNYMGHVNDYDLPIDYWKCILLDQRDNTCIHRYLYLDLRRDVYIFDMDLYHEYKEEYLNKILLTEERLILPGINLDDTQEMIDDAIRKDVRNNASVNVTDYTVYMSILSLYSRFEEIRPLLEFIYPNETDKVCNSLVDMLIFKDIKNKYDLLLEYSDGTLQCRRYDLLLLLRARGCILYDYDDLPYIPHVNALSELLQSYQRLRKS